MIQFSLSTMGRVNLTIYDLLGRKIRTLIDKEMPAGLHQVKWNGTDDLARKAATGIYFVQLQVGNQTRIQKMSLVK